MTENEIDWNEFWNRHIEVCDLLADTLGRSNAMDKIEVGIFCCMIMEKFCKAHSLDVIEFSQWIADNIRILNEIIGRYQ